MTKEEHLKYLKELEEEEQYTEAWYLPASPKKGAFDFGEEILLTEYIAKYREECKKRGWINA